MNSQYQGPVHRLHPTDTWEGLNAAVREKREQRREARREMLRKRKSLIEWVELKRDLLVPIGAVAGGAAIIYLGFRMLAWLVWAGVLPLK